MIRQDLILRMVDEFTLAGVRIDDLQKHSSYKDAFDIVKSEIERIAKSQLEEIPQLERVELLRRLVGQDPTIVARYKISLLALLLKQAGDLTEQLKQPNRAYYRIGLDLFLELFSTDQAVDDQNLPKIDVDAFVEALRGENLPAYILSSLTEYYESKLQYAKAEATLKEMLLTNSSDPSILRFGIAFYRRLENQNDATINAENISRRTIATSLSQLYLKERALAK